MKGALVWIAFVLTVSMGVTAKIASSTPAPNPARNCSPELSVLLSLPANSCRSFWWRCGGCFVGVLDWTQVANAACLWVYFKHLGVLVSSRSWRSRSVLRDARILCLIAIHVPMIQPLSLASEKSQQEDEGWRTKGRNTAPCYKFELNHLRNCARFPESFVLSLGFSAPFINLHLYFCVPRHHVSEGDSVRQKRQR